MATRLFFRETKSSGIDIYRDMQTTAGTNTTNNIQTRTTAGATELQFTRTTDGELLTWISGPSPAGGWTLSGTMTFVMYGFESSSSINASVRTKLYKRTAAGVETQSGGNYDYPSEIGTIMGAGTWTGTATSTTFAEGDMIMVKAFVRNSGTMGANAAGVQGRYDSASGGTGGSYFEFAQNVTFGTHGGTPPATRRIFIIG